MSKNKVLITSALPYVNNVPHLGNLVGSLLSADVYARFCRLDGDEVLYVCGSDEHGTATETKAKEEGVTPKELCDKYYELHKEIYKWFNISFDIFGRTSTKNHKKITTELFTKVYKNGFIEEKEVTQLYCEKCKTFLADRFVIGTCPHCNYEDARGDQCDNCGKLLNPDELINPKCKTDGSTPEFKKSEHLFLRLDKLQPELEKWVNMQSEKGNWSENAIRTTKAWFKEGLKPRAITRDLKWGISVGDALAEVEGVNPNLVKKYKNKVFYVWFDAPIGYISITDQLMGDDWKKWWMNKDVRLVQFMGKDNTPFHSIIFPGSLMAASDKPADFKNCDYKLVDTLSVTEYLNYEHTKFSKSRNIGVFGDNAKDSGIPADIFRFMLMYNRPEGSDTQFTWKGLQERLNNELLANLGNLVNRTIVFSNRFFEGNLIEVHEDKLNNRAKEFLYKHRMGIETYAELFSKLKIREALMQMMKVSSNANAYFQASEPWKTRKHNPETAQKDLTILSNVVKDLALMASPIMPSISKEMFKQLNVLENLNFEDLGKLSLKNHKLGEAKILFDKIEDEKIEELKQKYSGKSNEKETKMEENKNEQTENKPVEKSISNLHLQVGKIVEVLRHPKADKLYIEKVDVGEEEPIQIVSGLVPYYSAEDLKGKKIIVVRNLKPAKLRGEMSYGMLLAAEDESGQVGVIEAKEAKAGLRATTENENDSFKEEIKFDEFMKFKFELKEGKIFIDGNELKVEAGDITIDKGIINGIVS